MMSVSIKLNIVSCYGEFFLLYIVHTFMKVLHALSQLYSIGSHEVFAMIF